MSLRPLYIFHTFSVGIDIRRQSLHDVCRCQILMSKAKVLILNMSFLACDADPYRRPPFRRGVSRRAVEPYNVTRRKM